MERGVWAPWITLTGGGLVQGGGSSAGDCVSRALRRALHGAAEGLGCPPVVLQRGPEAFDQGRRILASHPAGSAPQSAPTGPTAASTFLLEMRSVSSQLSSSR